jgi:hypothetical protein
VSDDAGELVIGGSGEHRDHPALAGADQYRAAAKLLSRPGGGVHRVGDQGRQPQDSADPLALPMALTVDADDRDPPSGELVAELLVEQRMGHRSGQEHSNGAGGVSAPHGQDDR